ncbi:MAG: nickel-dependent hydrogenase large subunit [Candidatus Nezhaarchaeota archaeon]|nr:nickel-dependent hydrogenase large subunit [Candidatus Nezhaarchaeota archaeon]
MSVCTVPIGPFHPALKESVFIRLEVEGERVVGVDIKPGYFHRGVEWLAQRRTFHQLIFLCERVCGICSDAHATACVQTIEDLLQVEPPERALYLRGLVAELERLQSHFLWFGVALHLIGFDTAFMHAWRDREVVMRALEAITGKRVNYAYPTIGGVRRDLTPKLARLVEAQIAEMERSAERLRDVVLNDRMVRARTSEVGVLTKEDARKLCVVGPTARGSGIDVDVRRDDPYAAYDKLEWRVPVFDEGDVLAKTLVRLYEVFESIKIVRQTLREVPEGPIVNEDYRDPAKGREAFDRVEAPRGELFYYMRSNGTNVPEHVRIRTPSVANNHSLPVMMKGCTVADVPIIFASIDPCFACTDRVEVVNARTGMVKVATLEDLARRRITL